MKLTAGFQKTDKPTARLKNLKRDNNVRKRMCVYMYITYIYIYTYMNDWVTLPYIRKLTEHYKPTIMEKNKNC